MLIKFYGSTRTLTFHITVAFCQFTGLSEYLSSFKCDDANHSSCLCSYLYLSRIGVKILKSFACQITLHQYLVAPKFLRLDKRLSLLCVDKRQADIFLNMLLHNEICRLQLLRRLLSESGDRRFWVSSCTG